MFELHPVVTEHAVRLSGRTGCQDIYGTRCQIVTTTIIRQYRRQLCLLFCVQLMVQQTFNIDRQLTTDALVPVIQGDAVTQMDSLAACSDQLGVQLLQPGVIHSEIFFQIDRIGDFYFRYHCQHRTQIQLADFQWVIHQMQQICTSTGFTQGT